MGVIPHALYLSTIYRRLFPFVDFNCMFRFVVSGRATELDTGFRFGVKAGL